MALQNTFPSLNLRGIYPSPLIPLRKGFLTFPSQRSMADFEEGWPACSLVASTKSAFSNLAYYKLVE